jgi:DNA-directed RNA polymerase subunit RPC12/RpoP
MKADMVGHYLSVKISKMVILSRKMGDVKFRIGFGLSFLYLINKKVRIKKLLKDAGRTRKIKFIKCDCKNKVELIEEDIIKINGIKYITCPFCGVDILLK